MMKKILRALCALLALVTSAQAGALGVYPFTLPALPYAYDALEPNIDAATMQVHHNGHHQKYVDELNKALEKYPELHDKSVEYLVKNWQTLPVPADVQEKIRNNAGGHYNHSQFWLWMTPQQATIPDNITQKITQQFGSQEKFQEQFNNAAATVFGSGWAWLVQDGKNNVKIVTTANQDNPITDGLTPILGLDVWEHAYYLKHKNKKADYFDAWWNVVNWNFVEELLNRTPSDKKGM